MHVKKKVKTDIIVAVLYKPRVFQGWVFILMKAAFVAKTLQ